VDQLVPPPPLDRLFNGKGRLTQMPVREPLRRELMAWVATLLPPGRDLPETEVNNLLRPVDDDVAMLRRYLVDYGMVQRPRPGTYRRPVED
jgi:hypothetical protein